VPSLDAIVRRLTSPDAHLPRPEDASGPRAAVAVVLREIGGEGEILFIKRAEREDDPWSGHIAFPGGRHHPLDATLLETATRETHEEVGLDLGKEARALVRLPDIVPYSRMPHPLTVTPFVFAQARLAQASELLLNAEVAEAFWVPLAPVLRNDEATRFRYQRDGFDLDLPAYDLGARGVVWGLTYRMIELLREALA